MREITEQIRKRLFELSEEEYRAFSAKLMPEVDIDTVIGVRVPLLRKYAKELLKTEGIEDFIADLPHKYHEEYLLHGFIIGQTKDFDITVEQIQDILGYLNNWALTDVIAPKIFEKNKEKLLPYIDEWLRSTHTFTVRFAVQQLMALYLTDEYIEDTLHRVVSIDSQEYYINMCRAWLVATALAKFYDSTLAILKDKLLDVWTHNKSIQKAIESRRITIEQKEYLRTLKRERQK